MNRPIRVLELRSVRGTGGGPEKTIMLGAAGTDPTRFSVTVCYIRDRRDDVFTLDHRAKHLGIDYVEVLESHSFDRSIIEPLRQLLRSRQIDIVHSHDYKTNLLALLLARLEKIVPLSTAHGWTGNSGRERWLYYPADRRLLAWFPRVIAVSGDIRDALVRAGARADRVTVVLNGIDPERFKRNRDLESTARRRLADRTVPHGDRRGGPTRASKKVRSVARRHRAIAEAVSSPARCDRGRRRAQGHAGAPRPHAWFGVTLPLHRSRRRCHQPAPRVRPLRSSVGLRRNTKCRTRGHGARNAGGGNRRGRDCRAGRPRDPWIDHPSWECPSTYGRT